MDNRENSNKILDAMIQNEERMGSLYRLGAERFPSHRDLWSSLAEEERQHADWIRKLRERLSDGSSRFDVSAFDPALMDQSLQKTAALAKLLENTTIRVEDVLAAAKDLEESLLESKYFEIFTNDTAEIKQVKYCLAEATREHFERLADAVTQCSGPGR